MTDHSPAIPPQGPTGDGFPPHIDATFPANAQSDLPVTVRIRVDFSEPMNTTSVNWTLSGRRNATGTWSDLNTTLELVATKPFRDCTGYSVNITGRDADEDLPLVAGPAPNPWWFRTACINPFIVSTDPVDESLEAPTVGPINVTFSEPMNETSVEWDFSFAINLTAAWNRSREVLSLTPEVPLPACTVFELAILSAVDDQMLPLVSGPVPNPWNWFTYCPNPFIIAVKPAAYGFDVPLNASISVLFSRSMNATTLNWSIDPATALTPEWSPDGDRVTLRHASDFPEREWFTMEITRANDTDGLPLVRGPVPNPWNFETARIYPYVLSTDPANGTNDVPLAARIVVSFSERMRESWGRVVVTPLAAITRSWSVDPFGLSVLTIVPDGALTPCTVFTIEIEAMDLKSLPLVPGPVPNPWSFRTLCGPSAPAGLTVGASPPDAVFLRWQFVSYAYTYRVYTSTDRFAPFPSGWKVLGTTAMPQFAAHRDLTDGVTHYYLVRAVFNGGEGSNSTMGVKLAIHFGFSAGRTNIAWFSLAYRSRYQRASDIANELGSLNIDVVGKWDPTNQTSTVYYYARGGWRGTDFPIVAGDGLYLGVLRTFTWAVVGTDLSVPLSFFSNPPPRANVVWLGLPPTGPYAKASDVVNALGPSNITEVGLWNASSQSAERWYWDGSQWAGDDFLIGPAPGVYLIIANDFTWTPSLITPEMS